ncbi:hypothetical protein ACGFY3_40485 [Streptomyces mirabilis]|uniref:hypothetical protein n=1 Tax=Streptomyces mirabilis TaxID=68239 RepID=UPI0037140F68
MPGGPVFVGGHNWDGSERVGGVDALAEESAGTGVGGLGDERVFLKVVRMRIFTTARSSAAHIARVMPGSPSRLGHPHVHRDDIRAAPW